MSTEDIIGLLLIILSTFVYYATCLLLFKLTKEDNKIFKCLANCEYASDNTCQKDIPCANIVEI